eukprot:gene26606-4229_t
MADRRGQNGQRVSDGLLLNSSTANEVRDERQFSSKQKELGDKFVFVARDERQFSRKQKELGDKFVFVVRDERELSRKQKELGEKMLRNTEVLDLQNSLRSLDALHQDAVKPKEYAMDASLFLQITKAGADASRKLAQSDTGRGVVEFIQALKFNYVDSINPTEALQADHSVFDWHTLGASASAYLRKAPGASCMFGAIEAITKAPGASWQCGKPNFHWHTLGARASAYLRKAPGASWQCGKPNFDWHTLGASASAYLRKAPGASCMFGAIEAITK